MLRFESDRASLSRSSPDVPASAGIHTPCWDHAPFSAQEFPRFLEVVESAEQIDDTHLRWVASIGGKREEWDAVVGGTSPVMLIRTPLKSTVV